jgi:hypothetical protein
MSQLVKALLAGEKSTLAQSEQLKRKSMRQTEKSLSDDEDDEEFFLVEFEGNTSKIEYGVVNAIDVEVFPTNLDKGFYKYRKKTYTVKILKRGNIIIKIVNL